MRTNWMPFTYFFYFSGWSIPIIAGKKDHEHSFKIMCILTVYCLRKKERNLPIDFWAHARYITHTIWHFMKLRKVKFSVFIICSAVHSCGGEEQTSASQHSSFLLSHTHRSEKKKSENALIHNSKLSEICVFHNFTILWNNGTR